MSQEYSAKEREEARNQVEHMYADRLNAIPYHDPIEIHVEYREVSIALCMQNRRLKDMLRSFCCNHEVGGEIGHAAYPADAHVKPAQPEEPHPSDIPDPRTGVSFAEYVARKMNGELDEDGPTPVCVEQPATSGLVREVPKPQQPLSENQLWGEQPASEGGNIFPSVWAPTPPATGEACPKCDKELSQTRIGHLSMIADRECQYRKPPAPVADVEQAELPPLELPKWWLDDPESKNLDYRVHCASGALGQRERQLRAERAAHKATREELAEKDTYIKNRRMIISQFGKTRQELINRAESAEAENQELKDRLAGRDIMEFDLNQEGSQL